jgi:hypothetical protein
MEQPLQNTTDAVAALAHQHSLDADAQRENAIDCACQAMVAVHAAGDVAAAHAAQDLMNILRKGRSARAAWLSILKSRNLG